MKSTIRIVAIGIVSAITLLFFSCALAPMSIKDRINQFMSDINSNQSKVYKNLDPDSPNYNAAKPAAFWDDYFEIGLDDPFTYTPNPPDTSDPHDVEITINGNSGSLGNFQFDMKNIGDVSDNWVIEDIKTPWGGTSIFP